MRQARWVTALLVCVGQAHCDRPSPPPSGQPASAAEVEPAVPNRVSATELTQRDGELTFADFEIVQQAGDLPPHPLLARFVYDRRTNRWLMLNVVKIENEPPHVFVW